MVSFELGKEREKDVFLSCHELGTKEKKNRRFGTQFLMGTQNFFFVPRS